MRQLFKRIKLQPTTAHFVQTAIGIGSFTLISGIAQAEMINVATCQNRIPNQNQRVLIQKDDTSSDRFKYQLSVWLGNQQLNKNPIVINMQDHGDRKNGLKRITGPKSLKAFDLVEFPKLKLWRSVGNFEWMPTQAESRGGKVSFPMDCKFI